MVDAVFWGPARGPRQASLARPSPGDVCFVEVLGKCEKKVIISGCGPAR